ncbi:hypothetical protein F0562_009464 [Nyssa sinensis]|uniref:Uncharacterized protein n=1 Tax=Nyssa sinensis TaxID=561372 RepID=A0A5J5A108_9ASTE|nr:hypothetical protein F0562_009464 [Nyssa sinensis]
MMNMGLNNQTYSLDYPSDTKENLRKNVGLQVPQHGTPNPEECHLAYHGACTGMDEQSLLTGSRSTCARITEPQEDLLTGSVVERHEIPYQAPCKNYQGLPLNSQPVCYDIKKETYLMDPKVDTIISVPSNNLGYNETGMGCKGWALKLKNQMLLNDKKMMNKKQEIPQDSPANLNIDEKADIKGSHKCSEVNGGIRSDLAAFYTHLATRELQTTKGLDLEYIKELGSGTYGTVLYGNGRF